MEMNQRMAERADADIFAMVDSLRKADGSEFTNGPIEVQDGISVRLRTVANRMQRRCQASRACWWAIP